MMNSKRNQTIAIARFLMYKHSLNQQLDGMTDEVMEHQDALLRRLGTDYLSVIAFMPYEEDGGVRYA